MCRWYINTNITFVDIIHASVFTYSMLWGLDSVSTFSKNLLSWIQLIELVPVSGNWAQLRFYLNMEIESSLQNTVF
jgi:hypothetical protein